MSKSNNNKVPTSSKRNNRCFCNWTQCSEIQKVLQKHEPDGPFSGFVEIKNTICKNPDGVPAQKKLFLQRRLQSLLCISKQKIQNKAIYVAKHHWSPSIHQYALTMNKKLTSFFEFESVAGFRKISGTDDNLDIFKRSKNSVSAILAPNYPQSEWKKTYTYKYDETKVEQNRVNGRGTKSVNML